MHQTFRKTQYLPWGIDITKEQSEQMKREILADFSNCLEHGFIEEKYDFRYGMDIPAHTGPHMAASIDSIDVESFTFDADPWIAHALKMVVQFTPR